MKKFIFVMFVAIIGFAFVTKAQTVPFAYTQTMEFSKVDSVTKKALLKYANAKKYDSKVSVEADSVLQTVMVKGVKSRSGKVEDQVWMQIQEKGKVVNYLFALSQLPEIKTSAGKLTISAHCGDSRAMINKPIFDRNPWQ